MSKPSDKELEKTNGSLNEIGDKTAVKQLLESLEKSIDGEDDKAIKSNITALIKNGSSDIQSIIDLHESNDPSVRQLAVIILGEIGDERAIDPLIKNLNDPNERTRLAAIEALTKIGEKSVEPLIKALDDKDGKMKECAAEALFKIGSERALEAIKQLEVYNDLKNSTTKKMLLHPTKRDIYFPDKCIYCEKPKEDTATHKFQANIIKDNELVKVHLPYCESHSREARRNKVIIVCLQAAFFAIPWLITLYVLVKIKVNIVYGFLTLFLIAPIVFFALVYLVKHLLSKKIPALKHTSLLSSHADLGIGFGAKGPILTFEFHNKNIALEFDRNTANLYR